MTKTLVATPDPEPEPESGVTFEVLQKTNASGSWTITYTSTVTPYVRP